MHIDRTRAEDAFAAYVAAYDASNPRISLKVDHTLRVAALCDRIARSIGLPADDVDLAWLCGLLHDIGRFEQVRRWDTFSDAASVSHALLGVRVLFGPDAEPQLARPGDEGRIGLVREFVTDGSEDDLIRTAVATHSDYRLPQGLPQRTRTFCDVVRDADKVDILKAVTLEPMDAIFGVGEEQMRASSLSPAVLEAFRARRCVLRADRRQPADFLVSFACFCFELVYPESRRAALEQGCVFKILDRRLDDPASDAELRAMSAELRAWLERDVA